MFDTEIYKTRRAKLQKQVDSGLLVFMGNPFPVNLSGGDKYKL